jgi:protein TonB
MTALPRVHVTIRPGRLDSLTGFSLLSLAGHLLALGTLLAAASLMPTPKAPPPDPGFFVSLAAGGGAQIESVPAPEPEQAPAPPPPPVEKKVVELPEKPEEAKPKPPPKKPAKSLPEKEDKPSLPGPAAPGPEFPGAPPGPGVPGGEGEVTSLDIEDFEYAWYTARVVSRLKATWRRPVIREGELRAVTVGFSIHRNGSVSDVRVELPSGYVPLDLSAQRAVYDAAPLPPLPTQWRKADVLPARIIFELKPEK